MRHAMRRMTNLSAGWMMLALSAGAGAWVFEGRLVPPADQSLDAYTVILEHHEGRRQTPPSDFQIEQAPEADGRFRIDAAPHRGQYWLFVQDRDGRVLLGYPHLDEGRDFGTIELQDDGELMGALQTPEGEPAADVNVRLERKLEARCSHYVESGSMVSDVQGGFAIASLHPGDYRIRIESETYTHAATEVTVTADLNYLELQREPAASISGRVTLADGAPAAGVFVQAGRRTPPAVTDAEGRYRIGGLGPDTYRLRAWSESLAVEHAAMLPVIVGGDDVTAPGIVVVPVGTLRVTLEREAPGEPWPERLDIVLEARGERRSWLPFDAPLHDGVATFENVPPGNFSLRVRSEALGDVRTDVSIAGGEVTALALTLPEVFALHGQVLEESGDPLEGARVSYQSAFPSGSMMSHHRIDRMVHRHTRSDAEGRFSLVGLPAGDGTLTIQADDRVRLTQPVTFPADPDADVDAVFTLERGLTVAVRIVDEDGNPLPGATLRLTPEAPDGEHRHRVHHHDIRGESDADGSVSLRALTEGRYRVSVTAPDHFGDFEPVEIAAATEHLDDLVMTRGLEISGLVTEVDGTPVVDARVDVMMTRPAVTTGSRSMSSRNAVTDAAGAFRVGGLPPGTYRVTIRDSKSYEELSTLTDVPAGADELIVILAERHTIPLIILAPDGSPAAGAEYSVMATGRHRIIRSGGDGANKTDADGRAAIEVRGGSRYAVTVKRRPWVDVTHQLDLTDGRAVPESIEIRMQAGLQVSGTVVGTDGAPRVGVFVTAGELEPVQTDAQGAFEIPGIGPGVLAIRVHDDPERQRLIATHRLLIEDAAESVPPLRIALPDPGSVRGTLRDGEGTPLPDATVMLNSATDMTGRGPSYQAETDGDGNFSFESVMPGNYMLMAMPTGRHRHADAPRMPAMRMIEVAAGEATVADLPEATTPGQTLTGRITRDGAPVTDARVMFIPLGEDGRMGMGAGMTMMSREPAVTGPEGRYTVANLEPGHYMVMIVQAEHLFADVDPDMFQHSAPVVIEAGQDELDIAVTGVTLRGIAVRSDGDPAVGATVMVLPSAGGIDAISRHMMGRSAETDADGRFEVPHLAAGPLRITVSDDAHGQAVTATLELTADESVEHTIRLAPGLRITGTVSSEPEGARGHGFVLALAPDGNMVGGASIDEDGSFILDDVLPRDRYLVACLHQELVAIAQVVEPDADGELTFVLRPGGTVAVTVTGPAEQVAGRTLEVVAADGSRVPYLETPINMGYWGEMTRALSLLPTDEDGHTRVYGLPAGDYTVRLAGTDVQAAVTVRAFEEAAVELALE